MHLLHPLSVLLFTLATAASPVRRAVPQGIDVSDFQTSVDWATVKANGITFAYVKATEGTSMSISLLAYTTHVETYCN